jgi:hypothetical protein
MIRSQMGRLLKNIETENKKPAREKTLIQHKNLTGHIFLSSSAYIDVGVNHPLKVTRMTVIQKKPLIRPQKKSPIAAKTEQYVNVTENSAAMIAIIKFLKHFFTSIIVSSSICCSVYAGRFYRKPPVGIHTLER